MKKQIMSIVASAALLTTGAMAFDTTNGTVLISGATVPAGTIITENASGTEVKASYTSSTGTVAGALKSSTTQRGDALIYPAFNQKTGWGTEIVVRNTSVKAIVAKAVVYAGDDSRELVDFNIYLSGKDVCRFTIKDGKITSSDGSIRTYGILPHQVDLTDTTRDLTDYALIKFGDEEALSIDMPTEAGYVAIYGMEEADHGFHSSTVDHKDLYAAYAASLDDATTGRGGDQWRQLTNTNGDMVKGMFVNGVTVSPNVEGTADVVSKKLVNGTFVETTTKFSDVTPSLTGSVRIFNDAGRDVLLPAKALENFTDGNRMLWTEGEYASIADRRISTNDSLYVAADIELDAQTAFPATTATYTYANASGTTDNSLLITQPFKRTLAQLNVAGTPANGYSVGATDETTTKLATGTNFAFQVTLNPFDEDENGFEATPDEIGGTIITSPRTSDTTVVTPESFNKELQEIKPSDLEKSEEYNGKFASLDGIVEVTLPVASIVTQMTASKAGSSDEINWVYSDKTN